MPALECCRIWRVSGRSRFSRPAVRDDGSSRSVSRALVCDQGPNRRAANTSAAPSRGGRDHQGLWTRIGLNSFLHRGSHTEGSSPSPRGPVSYRYHVIMDPITWGRRRRITQFWASYGTTHSHPHGMRHGADTLTWIALGLQRHLPSCSILQCLTTLQTVTVATPTVAMQRWA
jgi:hypothetical protein